MKAFFTNIKTIFCSYSFTRATQLCFNYLRLIVNNRIPTKSKSQCETFLGYTIAFPFRPAFFGLLTEIFFRPFRRLEPSSRPLLIFDCGANIGIRLLYLKWLYPNAIFVCFEPNPFVLEYLKRNIEQNKLQDVSVHQVAIGGREGRLRLSLGEGVRGSGSATLMGSGELEHTVEVAVKKLSDFISQEIDIVKLDVEGVEGEVLEDLEQTGKIRMIKSVIIEYHFDGELMKYPLDRLLEILSRSGFTIVQTPLEAYNTKAKPVLYTCMIYAEK